MASMYSLVGPMFSGKTGELIRRLRLAEHADMKVECVKPKRDILHNGEICSKGKDSKDDLDFNNRVLSFPATEIQTVDELVELIDVRKPDLLGVDEAQFFLGDDFVKLFRRLHESREYSKLIVIMAGIDMTSEGEPMGNMPAFMALSEVEKLKAVCFRCKTWPPTATMSYYKAGRKSDQVSVGAADKYEAVCLKCWTILNG